MTTSVAVFAAQQPAGGSNDTWQLVAMLAAFGVFWLATAMHKRYKALHAVDTTTAPTVGAIEGVNSRSDDPSDPHDLALGTVEQQWGAVDYPDGHHRVALAPVPAAPPQSGGTVVPIRKNQPKPKLEEVVAQELAANKRPVDIIQSVRRQFGKSEATAKRYIRKVREGGAA